MYHLLFLLTVPLPSNELGRYYVMLQKPSPHSSVGRVFVCGAIDPGFKPPMPARWHVEEIGSAAMLAAKRSSGVKLEVNLREHVTHMLLLPSVDLKPRGDITRSPKQGCQCPKKGLMSSKIKKKKRMLHNCPPSQTVCACVSGKDPFTQKKAQTKILSHLCHFILFTCFARCEEALINFKIASEYFLINAYNISE